MKKLILVSIFALFCSGCPQTIVENQSNGALHQSPNSNAKSGINSTVNSNSNSSNQNLKGEKSNNRP